MITAGDFRKGVTFVMDGAVFYIVDFQHVKPGKGAAFVRTKIKNAMTGQTLERTFNPSEKFELAQRNAIFVCRRRLVLLHGYSNL